MGVMGVTNVATRRCSPEDVLVTLGDALAYMGSVNVIMGRGTVLAAMSPGLAHYLSSAGLSKGDVRCGIWEAAKIPESRFPPTLRPLPAERWLQDGDFVRVVAAPENVLVAVIGGAGSNRGPAANYAVVMPSHPSSSPTTVQIDG
jgi:hypothetical protein